MADRRPSGLARAALAAVAPRSPRVRRRLKGWYTAAEARAVRACLGYGPDRLARAIEDVGIRRGDAVLVHGAFRRANGFRGGPQDLVGAMLDAVGPDGHLAMVSMAYRGSSYAYARSGAVFDVRRTVSRMGIVSEVFRRRRGVRRSAHPLHPVLVAGPRADWVVAGHERRAYSCGPDSPFARLLALDAKVLFFDVGFDAFTFTHFLEDRFRGSAPLPVYRSAPERIDFVDGDGRRAVAQAYVFDPEAIRRRDWSVLREELENRGQLRRARVGATRLLAVSMRDAYARAAEIVDRGGHFYGVGERNGKGPARALRESVWFARATARRAVRLLDRSNRRFLSVVVADQVRYLRGAEGRIADGTLERAHAARRWLAAAQDATPDDGVSYGYFPCGAADARAWLPSYPESTGYIIPSFLAYAERFGDPDARARALRMAIWEADVQLPCGAVQAGHVGGPGTPFPASFNTGMVLLGLAAAMRASGEPRISDAARRMASFLCRDAATEGYFHTHGPRVSPARFKTYECLCAWSLHEYGREAACKASLRTAVRLAEAALTRQRGNGWFSDDCLSHPEAPLLHTIGYTLQGLVEMAAVTGREDFLRAVRRGVAPILARLEADGTLRARYRGDWTPASRSACLTGNAQLAVVCYRLFDATRERTYREAASAIVDGLKAHQSLDPSCPEVAGALPGSHPIFAPYMQAGYPNWATKFLLDALLLQAAYATRPPVRQE